MRVLILLIGCAARRLLEDRRRSSTARRPKLCRDDRGCAARPVDQGPADLRHGDPNRRRAPLRRQGSGGYGAADISWHDRGGCRCRRPCARHRMRRSLMRKLDYWAPGARSGARRRPPRLRQLQLWRLDCGSIHVSDFDVFSDTYLYPGQAQAADRQLLPDPPRRPISALGHRRRGAGQGMGVHHHA